MRRKKHSRTSVIVNEKLLLTQTKYLYSSVDCVWIRCKYKGLFDSVSRDRRNILCNFGNFFTFCWTSKVNGFTVKAYSSKNNQVAIRTCRNWVGKALKTLWQFISLYFISHRASAPISLKAYSPCNSILYLLCTHGLYRIWVQKAWFGMKTDQTLTRNILHPSLINLKLWNFIQLIYHRTFKERRSILKIILFWGICMKITLEYLQFSQVR